METLKKVMPKVFVNVASILLLGLAVVALVHIPVLAGTELLLGLLAGAYGFDKTKQLVSKLPGLK